MNSGIAALACVASSDELYEPIAVCVYGQKRQCQKDHSLELSTDIQFCDT